MSLMRGLATRTDLPRDHIALVMSLGVIDIAKRSPEALLTAEPVTRTVNSDPLVQETGAGHAQCRANLEQILVLEHAHNYNSTRTSIIRGIV
jgi:hypothetical protein